MPLFSSSSSPKLNSGPSSPSMFSSKSKRDSAADQSGKRSSHHDGIGTSGMMGTSNSLAEYYIPDKLVSSPTAWGAEARKQSRLAVGGFGAAAGRSSRNANKISKTDSMQSLPANDRQRPGSSSALASALELNGSRPDNSMPRARKWGAGRHAWGPNGGGHAALGAGGYESDEGVEIDYIRDSSSLHDKGKFQVKPTRGYDSSSSIPQVSTLRQNQYSDENSSSDASSRRGLFSRFFGMNVPSVQRGKWNKFKWILFAANFVLTCYTIAGFIAIMLAWSNFFPNSSALLIVNRTELILGTIAMCLCIITAIIGWTGILLNNRAFLSVYALMLWISFAFILAPGYIAYKRRTFNLAGKMNHLWSRELTLTGRRMIQTVLKCCGYYSPFIEAAADGNRCYARSELPGCKGPLIEFEREALLNIYAVAFSLVPAHLACVVITMLCANHVTYRFGKGITPARYRVDDQTIKKAYRKSVLDEGTVNSRSHLLLVDQTPLDQPRPPFWHDVSSKSVSKSK
ncbi:uncharacterized protein FA14DRAFT_161664 [Meira miltonrushii]|uniref:Tetraspanin Tsp2 n=1 Tax=Meira miltonrushii TaxID=1280837 RepID=A0A316V9A6_9BASI|nr:uncharacterized protein FA14DRAFT_161664 [Meira miltonrushii]PWN34167.1 hypothetical protein FA14DRAFT_161664 [Meira miltonrushii]